MNLQLAYDPDSGMVIMDLAGNQIGIHPRDALALSAGLANLVAQIPALQPADRPRVLIAGSMPNVGGRLNGR